MNEMERLQREVAEAVMRFHVDLLAITPLGMSVDMHGHSLVVTLEGVSSPAEKELARDGRARELLEKFHRGVFDAARASLDAAVERIVGRRVERSRLSVDPQTGDSVILFVLDNDAQRERSYGTKQSK